MNILLSLLPPISSKDAIKQLTGGAMLAIAIYTASRTGRRRR